MTAPATIRPAEAALLLQFAPMLAAVLTSLQPARDLQRLANAPERGPWLPRAGRGALASRRGITGGPTGESSDARVSWEQLAALVDRIRAERPDLLPALDDARHAYQDARGVELVARLDPERAADRPAALDALRTASTDLLAAVKDCLRVVVRAPRGSEPVPVPRRPFSYADAHRFGLSPELAAEAAAVVTAAEEITRAAAPEPLALVDVAPTARRRRPDSPARGGDAAPAVVGRALAAYVAAAHARPARPVELAAPAQLALFA